MNQSSYQSILQSSLTAHQSAVDKINSAFEEGQAQKEQIGLSIIPIAHVFLQSGLDKGVNFVGKQLAKRTGSKVIQEASSDYSEGGGQRVIEGFLKRRMTRNRVVPDYGEGENENLIQMDTFDESSFDPTRNYIPSQEALDDNVDDIEEMFYNQRQSQIQETNLDEETQQADDGSEISPADDPDDEDDDFESADEKDDEDEEPDVEADEEPDVGTNVIKTAGADVDDALDTTEAVAGGLDSDPVTAVAGLAIGVGAILASIFIGKNDHPSAPQVINPSFQQGA